MHELDEFFAEDGLLARVIPGYRLRTQQLEMAREVAAAIQDRAVLVAEAGTGTGKTFAYLVPAFLCGGKVIVSTGTKTLQEQLFNRDIPAVRQALRLPISVAMLKGRANYVCHYHLERAALEGRFVSREDLAYLPYVQAFAENSATGDKGELAAVPESSGIWPLVTSTRENCLGQECGHIDKCFVMEARKKALEADVVVVNHHLFFADLWLRDEGVAELLPACNTVIFDEAHQLPETASLFFGEALSTGQLLELARDATAEALSAAKDFAPLPPACDRVEKAARDLRLAFANEGGRLPWSTAERLPAFRAALEGAISAVEELGKLLASQAERAEGLANCQRRAEELLAALAHWKEEGGEGFVRWVEVGNPGVTLNATPLSIADIFRRQIEENARGWIFTSATLAVGRDFKHYQGQMGLEESRTGYWESPFDYPAQALLYAPKGLPNPNSPGYTEAVVEAAFPLLRASRGRAFLLFTSLKAMKAAQRHLAGLLETAGLDYPLLMQGEGTRSELLERFRRLESPILLGSQSFWEGVDVRGPALSLVVIDRLPFAPPDDPVLAARIEALNREGRNAFMEFQVPQAAITLKQGAGRLIRDETDHGVLMICDPRLVDKPYGRRLWQSLPPMRRTREVAEATAFLESMA